MNADEIKVRGRVYDRDKVETIANWTRLVTPMLTSNDDSVGRNARRIGNAIDAMATQANVAMKSQPQFDDPSVLTTGHLRGALDAFTRGERMEFVRLTGEVLSVAADGPALTATRLRNALDKLADKIEQVYE